MSLSPTTVQSMASFHLNGNGSHDDHSHGFQTFFESWLDEQDQLLQELTSVSKHDYTNVTLDEQDRALRPLIERAMRHYEFYYRAKSRWVKLDVLGMLSPSWTSSLEDAFLWIGGWRPSTAFHLLYSKSGLQLECQLAEIIRGLGNGDLGDLSPSQLSRVDQLQRETISEEKKITEKMAESQETVAESSMVELSSVVTELMNGGGGGGGGGGGVVEERVDSAVGRKEELMQEVLESADDLRVRTLKAVIEILSPIQRVHYLIAAAELHLRLHDWGKDKDAKRQQKMAEAEQMEPWLHPHE